MNKLSDRVVDSTNPMSLSARARARRWGKFTEAFPSIADMHVLDLGGTPDFWETAPLKPAHVTLVNLRDLPDTELVTAVQGDACAPPVGIASGRFDLVVSNSLIEHVGGHEPRARLAEVIHTASPSHWVQTPYRYFPVEPHWMFPGLQFLPFSARVVVTNRWKLGHRYTSDRQQAVNLVHEVDLIGITQMSDYFPQSVIWREKFAGLVKSIVAIRSV